MKSAPRVVTIAVITLVMVTGAVALVVAQPQGRRLGLQNIPVYPGAYSVHPGSIEPRTSIVFTTGDPQPAVLNYYEGWAATNGWAKDAFSSAIIGNNIDIFIWQAPPWPQLLDDVLYLEKLGFGTYWIADHPASVGNPATPALEAWTTLAALASRTTRIRLGTSVTNISTRHPAMLAKQAATAGRDGGLYIRRAR